MPPSSSAPLADSAELAWQIYLSPYCSNDQASSMILLMNEGRDPWKNFDQRLVALDIKNLADAAWPIQADQPVSKGTLAFMLTGTVNLNHTLMMKLIPSRRYAYKESLYAGLMVPGSDYEPLTGPEAVSIFSRAAGSPLSAEITPAAVSGANNNQASVFRTKGSYIHYSLDNGKTWKSAQPADTLPVNTLIRTGLDSICEIRFQNLAAILLEPLTAIRITDLNDKICYQKFHTRLLYGALQCAGYDSDNQACIAISTATASVSLQKAVIYLQYDPGTQRCLLAVEENQPIYIRNPKKIYELKEGMHTDCMLTRFQKNTILRRFVYVTGNLSVGCITQTEADAFVLKEDYNFEPTDGALQYLSDRTVYKQRPPETIIELPGPGIPVGDTNP